MNSKSPLDNWMISSLILIALLIAVTSVWIWLPPFLADQFEKLTDKGAYGDSYGSVNALFTGLAFAALIFTILLQQRDIKLQREDFKNQLDEMQLSRAEIARQADLQEKQMTLDMAALKLKPLEVRLAEIQILAEQWTPGARYDNVQPRIEALVAQMEEILKESEGPRVE